VQSERMRISNAGLVGINQTAPVSRLHVSAAVSNTDGIGTDQGPITVSSALASTTSLMQLGYRFEAGVAEYGRIQCRNNVTATPLILQGGGGNVGIGRNTTNAKLHVGNSSSTGQDGIFYQADSISKVSIGTFGSTAATYGIITANDSYVQASVGGLALQTEGAANPIKFAINTVEAARIDTNRRLLVGSTQNYTTFFGSNVRRLMVSDTAAGPEVISTYSDDQFGSRVDFLKSRATSIGGVTTVINGDNFGVLWFGGTNGTAAKESGAILVTADATVTGSTMPSRMSFLLTENGGTAVRDVMRITNAGNVGINTTSPNEKLAVLGKASIGNDFVEPGLTAERAYLNLLVNDADSDILFLDRGNAATRMGIDISDSRLFKHVTDAGGWIWYTGGTSYAALGTGTERFRIGAQGIALGTSSFGTSATNTLVLGNGVEPSTGPADTVQLYSIDDTAGNTMLGIRTEGSVVTTEAVTSDRTLKIRINGVTYKVLLKA
jgi:hypothetical protein